MWFKSYKHFHKLQRYARTDSHRDNSAHLWVMKFLFHCEAHQDVFNTYVLLLKHTKKQANDQNNKSSVEIANFKFTGLIRFRIIGQLTAFYSLSDETEVLSLYDISCWCDGNHEHLNHRHATFMNNQLVDFLHIICVPTYS